MAQPQEYQNLEKLERQLIEERRFEVAKWGDGKMNLLDAGRVVIELNAMIEAVRVAAKEERQAEGAASFLG